MSSFVTPTGSYSYEVMSFGLRNAPATFQRHMIRAISGLDGWSVYLNDLVVFSNNWETHNKRVSAVLRHLSEAKLPTNLAKYEFARATVMYLGKMVRNGEVHPVHAKIQAIQKCPVPVTKKEQLRFLGLMGYYCFFCHKFSPVVAPLTDLLKR